MLSQLMFLQKKRHLVEPVMALKNYSSVWNDLIQYFSKS